MVDLRSLMLTECVLDGELVQAQLHGQSVHVFLGRRAEVDPDDGVRLLEVLRDIGNRKVLGLENTLAVHPGLGHRF
jgi:hypothetical protein